MLKPLALAVSLVAAGLVLAVPVPEGPEVVELFAAEAWYQKHDGKEREFTGLLTQFKRPTLGMEGNVLDHFRREATDVFLRSAGDRVMSALRPAGEPPFHSVFCDSLEVFGADWTGDLLAEFRTRRGYDLAPYLPALWQEAGAPTPHVRHDYHLTLSDLTLDGFFRPRRQLPARPAARGLRDSPRLGRLQSQRLHRGLERRRCWRRSTRLHRRGGPQRLLWSAWLRARRARHRRWRRRLPRTSSSPLQSLCTSC